MSKIQVNWGQVIYSYISLYVAPWSLTNRNHGEWRITGGGCRKNSRIGRENWSRIGVRIGGELEGKLEGALHYAFLSMENWD